LLPIDHLVFFKSSNNTILKSNPNVRADFSKVCKGRDIFNKIEDNERRYKQVKIGTEKMSELGKLILSQHSPRKINILEGYGLLEKDILSGVRCPSSTCYHIPMDYRKGKWICPKCNTLSKNGHIEALLVHFLLINPTITNKECQNLLHLPSRDSTQKFLLSLNLPTTGHTKNRQYHQWSYPESYFILEENQIKPIFCQEKVPACVLS